MKPVNPSDRRNTGNTSLGKLIKSKREAAGLTMTRLASELGVSRPYLSRLERGEYAHPSSRILTQIIKRLDLNVEDVYALTGYALPADLPSYGPYLRAKHVDWPEAVLQELENFYDFVKQKYSLE